MMQNKVPLQGQDAVIPQKSPKAPIWEIMLVRFQISFELSLQFIVRQAQLSLLGYLWTVTEISFFSVLDQFQFWFEIFGFLLW